MTVLSARSVVSERTWRRRRWSAGFAARLADEIIDLESPMQAGVMTNRAGAMRRVRAIAGSAAFLVVAPGVVAGLGPWWLTGWQEGAPYPWPARVLGLVLAVAAAAVLLGAFAQFAVEGSGTPAPVAPTERLVVRGLYRYVRNPMYLAVLAVIAGQALWLSRPVLLGYAAGVAAAFAAFVRWYEQPTLSRRYGAQYQAYRREVPGWWPRRPRPAEAGGGPRRRRVRARRAGADDAKAGGCTSN